MSIFRNCVLRLPGRSVVAAASASHINLDTLIADALTEDICT